MQTKLDEAKRTLDWYYETKKSEDENDKKLASNYFQWTTKKTKLLHDEKLFSIPNGTTIKRGFVFWVDFGYNIGSEFGGEHPAIILGASSGIVFVVPLGSGDPSTTQKQSGIYVKVPKVWTNLDEAHVSLKKKEFPNMTRWVNVLNAVAISEQRIIFEWANGNVKGSILDKINEALEQYSPWVRRKSISDKK